MTGGSAVTRSALSGSGAAYNGKPFSRTFTAEQAKQLQFIHYQKGLPRWGTGNLRRSPKRCS